MKENLPFLVFNNHNSIEFGLLITEKGSFKGAARDISYTSVPGRSGDLITDNGRYKNIKIPYKFSLLNATDREFSEIAQLIKGWLLSEQGYFRLYDSYDTKCFRMAAYSDEINIEQELRCLGSLSLTFNCKPFKYSFEGQNAITMTTAGTLYNAEFYPSKPYIKVVGNGTVTLTINGNSFLLSDIDEYIELDSEMMNAYKGIQAQNNKMSSDLFPVLMPGNNVISWVGDVEQIEIIPRWCCL